MAKDLTDEVRVRVTGAMNAAIKTEAQRAQLPHADMVRALLTRGLDVQKTPSGAVPTSTLDVPLFLIPMHLNYGLREPEIIVLSTTDGCQELRLLPYPVVSGTIVGLYYHQLDAVEHAAIAFLRDAHVGGDMSAVSYPNGIPLQTWRLGPCAPCPDCEHDKFRFFPRFRAPNTFSATVFAVEHAGRTSVAFRLWAVLVLPQHEHLFAWKRSPQETWQSGLSHRS